MKTTLLFRTRKTSAQYLVYLFLFALVIHLMFIFVSCQQSKLANPCGNKQNCSECVQRQSCGWCSKQNFPGNRCSLISSETAELCAGKYFFVPKNDYAIIEDEELTYGRQRAVGGASHMTHISPSSPFISSFSSSTQSTRHHQTDVPRREIVQIKPQHVKLKLGLNDESTFSFNYQQAEDYPIDLYYLMDLSMSMEDDKEKLSALGDYLVGNMTRITSNFRLGFGSFVDKAVLPFIQSRTDNKDGRCPECPPPYGFKNNMRLSENTHLFSSEVNNSRIMNNLDNPEGTLDAIIQAVVCRNEIGWRDQARRLLLVATDNSFHYAGDGKIGGLVEPNDGECHLDANGYYNKTLEQDYPSVGQINAEVKKNAINVIFAVVEEQIEIYSMLSKFIEGSSIGKLTGDSSNVVDLVKDQYYKISSIIEMKDNASSNYLELSYFTNCLNKSEPVSQRNKCDGLKIGDKVEFEVRVKLKKCPKNDSEWNQTIKIYPVGINESMILDVEMLCDCPCMYPGDSELYQPSSPFCSGHGALQCGQCKCDRNYYGSICECYSENTDIGSDHSATCRPNNFTAVECSGRGKCFCGKCVCDKRPSPDEKISGDFCQCDNFSCARHDGRLCSGPDHGMCVCGQCACAEGWIHDDCSCADRNDACIAEGSDMVCSGNGKCLCGSCECFENDEGVRYSGRYCEKCSTCPSKCKALKDCVLCRVHKDYTKITETDCKNNCSWFDTELVDTVALVEDIHEDVCYGENTADCKFEFAYGYNTLGKITIEAEKELQCSQQTNVPGIAAGVIGTIVLIGLMLLLAWKIVTSIQDSKEFAKFEEQKLTAKWDTDGNPLYKQPTTVHKNPMYETNTAD